MLNQKKKTSSFDVLNTVEIYLYIQNIILCNILIYKFMLNVIMIKIKHFLILTLLVIFPFNLLLSYEHQSISLSVEQDKKMDASDLALLVGRSFIRQVEHSFLLMEKIRIEKWLDGQILRMQTLKRLKYLHKILDTPQLNATVVKLSSF